MQPFPYCLRFSLGYLVADYKIQNGQLAFRFFERNESFERARF